MSKQNKYYLVPAVNCEWSDWEIGECSVTCAGGRRTNSRTKTVEESDGTDEDGFCEGEPTMEEDCNTQACPSKFSKFSTKPFFFKETN